MATEVQKEVQTEVVIETPQPQVAKNAGFYLAAQIVSWIVTFASVSIIPRSLGETVQGEKVVADTVVTTVLGFITLGIEYYLTREIGRNPQKTNQLLRAAFGLRLVLILPMAFVCLSAIHLIKHSANIVFFAKLGLIGVTLTLFHDPLRFALVGREQGRHVALTDLLFAVSTLAAIPFLRYGAAPIYYASIVFGLIILALRAHWLWGREGLWPTFDWRLWKQLVSGGLPFLLNSSIGLIYLPVTVLILRHFTDDAAVGQFSQASKLIGTFMFVPTALNMALLPSLSRLSQSDPAGFKSIQLRVISVLIVFTLPIMTGVILLATPLCHLLYTRHQYQQLPLALQYSALTILPLYIVSTIYQFLVAQNRNGIWTYFVIGSVALFSVCAWFLVPFTQRTMHNGIVGVVLANLIAETASTVCAFLLLKTNPFTQEMVTRLIRGLLATAAMAAVIWFTRGVFIVIPAVLGSLVFIVMTWVLRVLPPQEQEMVLQMVKRKLLRRVG